MEYLEEIDWLLVKYIDIKRYIRKRNINFYLIKINNLDHNP